MNKAELLAELDSYFATRGNEVLTKNIGSTINVYKVQGAITRANNRAEERSLIFYVYDEDGPGEAAFYASDTIDFFWSLKVIDYITVENAWSGRIFSYNKPKAICRVLETAVEGEKWVLITETAPDVYLKEDIAGSIIIDL